jgi:WD40 repeat protein
MTGWAARRGPVPGGKLLATADANGTVRLWNPATGQPIGKPLPADTGPHGGVSGVAFSPDGKLLASAADDGTVRLWNPATGQPVGTPLPGPVLRDSVSAGRKARKAVLRFVRQTVPLRTLTGITETRAYWADCALAPDDSTLTQRNSLGGIPPRAVLETYGCVFPVQVKLTLTSEPA